MLDRDLGEVRIQDTAADRVLIASRTEVIVDRIHLFGTDYIDPASFQRGLYPHWGILRRLDGGVRETFLLTERPFYKIDRFFGHLPSKLIEFYLNQAQGGQATVLDAGGGRDAKTAREVAAMYPDARVINVDMVAINESQGNFAAKQGDICNLDLLDGSINFAYSHQVLPYMRDLDGFSRRIRVIEEVGRVLKAGGTGVIDYTDDSSISGYTLKTIGQQIDGLVLPRSKSYGGAFLLIARNPINPAII